MKKNLFLSMSLLAIAGLWTGCSEDEAIETAAQLQNRAISFGVQGGTPQVTTRTTGTTAEYVNAFVVSGTDDKTPMGIEGIYNGDKRTLFWNFSVARTAAGTYDYSPKRYYQKEATGATFFAYSPVSNYVTHNSGVPGANVDNLTEEVAGINGASVTFDYVVEKPKASGDTSQEDLLVAWSKVDQEGIYGNKKVQLDFVHALSRVFVTGQNKTSTPVRIKNLEFINLYEDGTATITGTTTGKGMQENGTFEKVDDVVKWTDHKTRAEGTAASPGYAYVLAESGAFLEASHTSGEVSGDPKWLVSKEQGMMVVPQTLLGDFEVQSAADIKYFADVVVAAAANVATDYKAFADAADAIDGVTDATAGTIKAIVDAMSMVHTTNDYSYAEAKITFTDDHDAVTPDKDGNITADVTYDIDPSVTRYSLAVTKAGGEAYVDAYKTEYIRAYRAEYDREYTDQRATTPPATYDAARLAAINAAKIDAAAKAVIAGENARKNAVAIAQREQIVKAIGDEGIVGLFAGTTTPAPATDGLNKDVAAILASISAIAANLDAVKESADVIAAVNSSTANGTAFDTAYKAAVTATNNAKTNASNAVSLVATAFGKVADAISPTTSTNIAAVEAALKAAEKALSSATVTDITATTLLAAAKTDLGNTAAKATAAATAAKAVAAAEVGSDKFNTAKALANAAAQTAAGKVAAAQGLVEAVTAANAATNAATALADAKAAALEANIALSGVYFIAPTEGVFALRVDYELSNITQTTYIRLPSNFPLLPSKQYLINLVIEGKEINFDVKVAGFADPEYVNWEPIVTP